MPLQKTKKKEFYREVVTLLNKNNIPFLIGGTFAVREYTGINRDTSDLDIFCKAGDILDILKLVSEAGYKTELADDRWLGKAYFKKDVIDFIFDTPQGVCPVDDSWFLCLYPVTLFEQQANLIPPEELIWSKSYRQDRFKYEGPDVNHLILKLGEKLDWNHLLSRMEPHWEILFAHLLNFRFIYPSQRNIPPRWLIEELIHRLQLQLSSPLPKAKVCRGPLLAIDPYKIDIFEWGYKDIF